MDIIFESFLQNFFMVKGAEVEIIVSIDLGQALIDDQFLASSGRSTNRGF